MLSQKHVGKHHEINRRVYNPIETSVTMANIKKPYYELSINAQRIRIKYVLQNQPSEEPLANGALAVAWLEEKDTKVHYFWFKLSL
jgi:hypothetical protein